MFSVFFLYFFYFFKLYFSKSIHAKQSNYFKKKSSQKVPNQRFVEKHPLIWFFRGIIGYEF